jgi:hypothetical protein
MKSVADTRLIQGLEGSQRGVFSKADLQTAFGERHPAAFARRINALLDLKILRRFTRGWYVTEEFDLATLSQRLAPSSYISFSTMLARHLIVGPDPEDRIVAVKTGRPRRYALGDFVIEHVSVTETLLFGFETVDGVRYADAEKASIDTLYFHLRGRRYPFDIYSDMAVDKLDHARVRRYLERYNNPKFVAFAEGVLMP